MIYDFGCEITACNMYTYRYMIIQHLKDRFYSRVNIANLTPGHRSYYEPLIYFHQAPF